MKVSGANHRAAGQTLVALIADPEPIGDRRAILDVILSTGEETKDNAFVALARLLENVDLLMNSDVLECILAGGPRGASCLARP